MIHRAIRNPYASMHRIAVPRRSSTPAFDHAAFLRRLEQSHQRWEAAAKGARKKPPFMHGGRSYDAIWGEVALAAWGVWLYLEHIEGSQRGEKQWLAPIASRATEVPEYITTCHGLLRQVAQGLDEWPGAPGNERQLCAALQRAAEQGRLILNAGL